MLAMKRGEELRPSTSHANLALDEARKAKDCATCRTILSTLLPLGAGFVGTILAGGLFPLAMLVLASSTPSFYAMFGPPGLDVAIIGFPVGAILAAVAGSIVFAAALVAQLLTRLRGRQPLIAAIAGGWTGFAAVLGVDEAYENATVFPVLLAMLMGQSFAGLASDWMQSVLRKSSPAFQLSAGNQFSVRQFIGVVTWAAFIAALLARMNLPSRVVTLIGWGVAFQLATLGAYLAAARIARERIARAELRDETVRRTD
jgi:hypothetical protein